MFLDLSDALLYRLKDTQDLQGSTQVCEKSKIKFKNRIFDNNNDKI